MGKRHRKLVFPSQAIDHHCKDPNVQEVGRILARNPNPRSDPGPIALSYPHGSQEEAATANQG